jgi:hypothetical protein
MSRTGEANDGQVVSIKRQAQDWSDAVSGKERKEDEKRDCKSLYRSSTNGF